MIGHYDELVEQEFSRVAIVGERFDKKISSCLVAEDWLPLRGHGGEEEDAVGIHCPIIAGSGRIVSDRCHKIVVQIPKGYTGPEGQVISAACNAALKGRSSTSPRASREGRSCTPLTASRAGRLFSGQDRG